MKVKRKRTSSCSKALWAKHGLYTPECRGGLVLVAATCICLLRWFCGVGSNTGNRTGKFQWVLYSRIWTDMSAFVCSKCLKNPVRNFSYMLSTLCKNSKRLALNILVSHHVCMFYLVQKMIHGCCLLKARWTTSVDKLQLLMCDILAFCTRFFSDNSASWREVDVS